jgi:uncharacterized protein involved in response to NO
MEQEARFLLLSTSLAREQKGAAGYHMQRSLLLHEATNKGTAAAHSLPLLAKAFRPFFLLAAIYAVVMVPLWLAVIGGNLPPNAYLQPSAWHAHEMIWGFVIAVVAGFLLTAVGNWTQRETATGAPLAGLVLLWLAGRLAMLFAGELPRGVPAAVDLAFLPVLGGVLARPLIAAKNRRNFVMLAIVAALFAANLIVHLEGLALAPVGSARLAGAFSVDLVVLLILLIGGRVFPTFTRNATGVASIRNVPWLDRGCVAAMVGLLIADAVAPSSLLTPILAGVAGLLAAARAVHWGTRHSLRDPLLWVLHLGYGWLVIGLLLRASAGVLGAPSVSMATHALTVGAIGTLTLGMMARVALGHTGRMLVAPSPMTAAFVAITLAALARVLGPWLLPEQYLLGLVVAGIFWVLAFAVFLAAYSPILCRPRVDGRPG